MGWPRLHRLDPDTWTRLGPPNTAHQERDGTSMIWMDGWMEEETDLLRGWTGRRTFLRSRFGKQKSLKARRMAFGASKDWPSPIHLKKGASGRIP